MPNSWRKVTRLTANEEQAFTRENGVIFEEIKKSWQCDNLGWNDDGKFEHYFIYRQQVGADTFYRILRVDNMNPNFISLDIRFYQYLIYRNMLVASAPYNRISATTSFNLGNFNSIDIISDKEKVKGILITEMFVNIYISKTGNSYNEWVKEWDKYAYRKGQLYGSNMCYYYLMDDAIKRVIGQEYSTIRITASACLVDPNSPLRYSLQNAFDGDPSTSYVENTDDDLLEIYFGVDCGDIEAIAIINGYAQNKNLYKSNNRVKVIEDDKGYGDKYCLIDDALTFQILIPYGNNFVYVTEVFKGDRYNDTCIAEINVKVRNDWLFGDIDE
jgi:hypothetical protein